MGREREIEEQGHGRDKGQRKGRGKGSEKEKGEMTKIGGQTDGEEEARIATEEVRKGEGKAGGGDGREGRRKDKHKHGQSGT